MAVISQKMPAGVTRFNFHQRLQHFLMALSVLMLIVTGFPIKYAGQQWAQDVVNLFGSFATMFRIHMVFAVLMLVSGAYHMIWLVGVFATRGPVLSMVPSFKDVRDVIDHLKFLLGMTLRPPQFDRYSWLEKFEYFAIYWGVIMMGVTGLILWFPRLFTWMPRWGMDVARVAHSNEAFVAMLAVVMGHFFAVHFNPRVFPTSKVWLTGKISMEHLAEEHPLEYQRLAKEAGLPEQAEEHLHGPARSLLLVGVELVIYLAIFCLLLYTFIKLLLI